MNKKMFYEAPDAELIELNLDNNQMDAASLGSPDIEGDEKLDDLG